MKPGSPDTIPISPLSRWIGAVEKWVIASLVIFLVLFSFLQIILRNFFSTGIIWGDSLLRQIVLWVSLLGAARAAAENKHIQIDLLPKLLPAASARVLGIISSLFAVVVSATLLYASITFVQSEMSSSTIAFLDIPNWWLETVFPLCFAIMTLRFGYQLVEGPDTSHGDLRE
jgi:TRAP-type C4-dicarboxylate transport system permease small subunit